MWYVMQVMSGKELQTILMMERGISCGILENCFVPVCRMKKKYQGRWQEITEKLFPGYVFLISSEPQSLYRELKQIPALTKLLGNCEQYFTPLSKKDERFLMKLQNMQTISHMPSKERKAGLPEVELSRVIVEENRKIRIVSGPLRNLEGQIKKINLHKRIAVVEAEFMGNKSLLHLGIEIVGKGEDFYE